MFPFCGLLCTEAGSRSAYGDVDATMFRNRILAAGMASLTVGLAVSTIDGDAQQSETAMTCINPVSGTSWRRQVSSMRRATDAGSSNVR